MSHTTPSLADLRADLRARALPADAVYQQRYFKTGPGEYGEGDKFLGLRVPTVRRAVRPFRGLPLNEITMLLRSEWHEERLAALLLMVQAYERGDRTLREAIVAEYLSHTPYINNWDLVDTSAPPILGAHTDPSDLALLERLAASVSLWERRIAMLATREQIRAGEFGPALRIAFLLLHDRHDLIHKAVGWMLREIGERDRDVEEGFLRDHYRGMPRTMLRYAIEKFPEQLRKEFLEGRA